MELAVYSPLLTQCQYASPKEAMQHARSIGITAVDIFGHEIEQIALPDYQKYYQESGIRIRGIVQGASLSDPDAAIRSRETEKVRQLVALAEKNNIEHIMIAPQLQCKGAVSQVQSVEDKLFVRDMLVENIAKIVSFAKDFGVAITLENFSMHTHPFSTVDEMLYLLQNIPGLKYTFDIGNFYCVREDVLKGYHLLKHYIQNVHIKDWVLDEFGYLVRPEIPALNGCVMGSGILPLKELISLLYQDGFTNELLLEVNTVSITKEIVEQSVNFVKSQWENAI